MRWGLNQWLIMDAFRREWRFWIPPIGERPHEARVSRWDMVGEPLFHILHQAFSESGAREDEAAGDLLAIYDTLTGSRLSDDLPRPTVDRRRRLRGFDRELSRVLYAALEAGVLRYERHEVPWPFPEKDDKPPSKRDTPGPATTFIAVKVVDGAAKSVATRKYRMVLPDGSTREGKLDGQGALRFDDVTAGEATFYLVDEASEGAGNG